MADISSVQSTTGFMEILYPYTVYFDFKPLFWEGGVYIHQQGGEFLTAGHQDYRSYTHHMS